MFYPIRVLAPAAVGALLALLPLRAKAAGTFIVSTTADSGPNSLRQAILELANQPCEQLITSLAARTVEFTQGVPQEDDMTGVMLRYLGDHPS